MAKAKYLGGENAAHLNATEKLGLCGRFSDTGYVTHTEVPAEHELVHSNIGLPSKDKVNYYKVVHSLSLVP